MRSKTLLRMLAACLFGLLLLTACGSVSPAASPGSGSGSVPGASLTPFLPRQDPTTAVDSSGIPLATATEAPVLSLLWITPAASAHLTQYLQASGLPLTGSYEQATLRLELSAQNNANSTEWIYALVAPFPTLVDAVSREELQAAWQTGAAGPFAGRPLWLSSATLAALTSLWGPPAQGAVTVAAADQLLASAWADQPAWAILPFEELEPRWKVLSLDGMSPVHNDFDPDAYPLKVRFSLNGGMFPSLPSNRDPSRLTVLAMTGVTALVRGTADRMEKYGVLYPGQEVGAVLRSADITHVSNEVPFVAGCPVPDIYTESMQFCSDPKYIQLLEWIGVDVVELTGNHELDYGPEAFLETLGLYDERNWLTFGGGRDLGDSLQPALVTDHGNQLAFLGCNFAGPPSDLATTTSPGSAPCELESIQAEMTRLTEAGYLVIMTIQYNEYYQFEPTDYQQEDFREMADFGAVIVSGSQCHVPAAAEFYGASFIHYGLGNLFFDQMNHLMPDGSISRDTRNVMIDRYTIYHGKVISTELLTYRIEDYARPRLMTADERLEFLRQFFAASGW